MNIEIANRLVQLRKAHNLSQEQLAEKVGVSRQAVSKWERAEASPDTDNLIALSKIYGMSLDAMLFSEDKPELSVRTVETDVSAPRQQEEYSQRQGNGTFTGDGEGSAGNTWEGNGSQWQGAYSGWQENSAEWQGNGADPGFQRNWGAPEWKKISKLMHAFPYPVFITVVYLILGFVMGWWHPGWMLYLTVPMYYVLADAIGKAQ